MTEQTFEIGQIFSLEYPPEAAEFCNESGKYFIAEIEAGEDGQRRFQIQEVPAPTDKDLAAMARARRDQLITQTDYLLMPDYPISEENLEAVKAYRTALRDLPEQDGFPRDIEWPEAPTAYKES